MLKVTSKNKDGNKITYNCIDTSTGGTLSVDKQYVVDHITQFENVRIQKYKGQIIIRLKDDVTTNSSSNTSNTPRKPRKPKNNNVVLIDVYKKLIKEFGILSEEEALSIGFDLYELDQEVDTTWDSQYTKIVYQMASTIKKIADRENYKKLLKYKLLYDKAHQ